MNLCKSCLRWKPLYPRSNRSVSATEGKPDAVVSATHCYLTGLDKLPSNRYIYRLTEPNEGPSLEGCRVKKPAGTITLSSEEGEALIAHVHQSNVPAAVAGRVEQIIRMYFWLVFALQEAKLSVKRLRTLLFGSSAQARPESAVEATSSEAPRQVAGEEEAAPVDEVAPRLETTGRAVGAGASESETKSTPQGGHRTGTGRLGADAYVGAERTECRHEDLAVGQRCPVCGQGTLYALPPGVEIRINGHALLSALRSKEIVVWLCTVWSIVTLALGVFVAPTPSPWRSRRGKSPESASWSQALHRLLPIPGRAPMASGKVSRDLGYVEGQNLLLDSRYAEEQPERFLALAAELVSLTPDVIWTHGDRLAQAAKQSTTTIPIVVGVVAELVERRAGEGPRATRRQPHRARTPGRRTGGETS